MTEREPDWDTIAEQEIEARRDASMPDETPAQIAMRAATLAVRQVLAQAKNPATTLGPPAWRTTQRGSRLKRTVTRWKESAMPDPDDRVASTLAEARRDAGRDAGCCGHTGYGCSCGPACRCGCPGCPACAAVKAVLELADRWSRSTVKGSSLELIRQQCAESLRGVITAALTGKDGRPAEPCI